MSGPFGSGHAVRIGFTASGAACLDASDGTSVTAERGCSSRSCRRWGSYADSLAPRLSPNKTWSGALGGTLAAVIAAVAVGQTMNYPAAAAVGLLGGVLSVCAQAGDLFESFLKRRFGAKDSSHIIPGHGGLMDRLDGFVTAATVAALIGLARGGLAAPGRGLLAW